MQYRHVANTIVEKSSFLFLYYSMTYNVIPKLENLRMGFTTDNKCCIVYTQ